MAKLYVSHIIGTRTTYGNNGIWDDQAIQSAVDHCMDLRQTSHVYYGAYNTNIVYAVSEMKLLAESSIKLSIRLRHFLLTFSPDERNWLEKEYKKEGFDRELYRAADDMAHYCAENYQVVYAAHETTHENTHVPHIHIIMNTCWYKRYPEYGQDHNYYGNVEYIDSYLKNNYGMYLQTIKREE